MIKVSVVKQTNYPVSSMILKKRLVSFLTQKGIVSDSEVSIALVGEKKMLEVSNKFLKDKKLHSVLSFTEEELGLKFVYPPDGKIYLGEIIVCYPASFKEAQKENKLIEEKVYELVEHGARHLLGEHHDST